MLASATLVSGGKGEPLTIHPEVKTCVLFPTVNRVLSSLYQLAWQMALPFLRRAPRLAEGWEQRILADTCPGSFDLWIQSASGGESMLSNAIIDELSTRVPGDTPLRVLATSTTPQGTATLHKGMQARGESTGVRLTIRSFPFDSPKLMRMAFARFRPRLIVLLETELWPALLDTAKQQGIPVLLINGRMSKRSFRSYQYLGWLFSPLAPTQVLAISLEDQARFSRVLGPENIGLMNNIKFDRINPRPVPDSDQPLAGLLPANVPFVLFGSIRREEEQKVLTAIKHLLTMRPDIVIGLFPKHLERANGWLTQLGAADIPAILRSRDIPCLPGSVIVWDKFGELASAYGLARSAFIGGSLVDLGGQNFLEPLVFGLKPVIGPYWSNFAWVSREIVDVGLVHEVADERQLAEAMLQQLDTPTPRSQVIAAVERFLAPRKGGTGQASQAICRILRPHHGKEERAETC